MYRINDKIREADGYFKFDNLIMVDGDDTYIVKLELFGRAMEITSYDKNGRFVEFRSIYNNIEDMNCLLLMDSEDENCFISFCLFTFYLNRMIYEFLCQFVETVVDNPEIYEVIYSEICEDSIGGTESEINYLDDMDGYEFESFCKELLMKIGFSVEKTKNSRDGGIDLIAINSNPLISGKYLVQCKRYKGSVGEHVIRDLYGVVMSEKANKGIIITTGYFTNSALNFAKDKQIELIDREKLFELLKNYNISFFEHDGDFEHISHGNSEWMYRYDDLLILDNAINNEPNNPKLHDKVLEIVMFNILKSSSCENSKQDMDYTIDLALKHLMFFDSINIELIQYRKNVYSSIICIIKGDLFNAYKYSSESIKMLKNKFFETECQDEDDNLSINMVVHNHIIQLCNILGLECERDIICNAFYSFIEYRKEILRNNINDDSTDWADPDEDINDILGYMEEQHNIYTMELDGLNNFCNITFFYIPEIYCNIYDDLIYHKEFPKNFFTPFICDTISFKLVNIIKDEINKPIGIKEYPLWQFSESIDEISKKIKLLL